VIGIVYVLWSFVPVVEAVLFSFNKGRSITQWEGFSLRWYVWDPTGSVLHNPGLQHAIIQSIKLASLTVLIAVPLGVAFAIALHHWVSVPSKSANFLMLFSFVTPELILAVALFLLFLNALRFIGLGTEAQVIGLVVLMLAYSVVIVRARLLSLGRSYEEAAMDLGASPVGALRRVLLPLLSPAIFASAAIVFAAAIDNFVISSQLSSGAGDQTVPIMIYSAARRGPLPSLNALATLTLSASMLLIGIAVWGYRRGTRGERKTARTAIPLV